MQPDRRLTRNAAACDGPGCTTWSREPDDHGFLELVWAGTIYLFCSPDCTLRLLAERSEPMTVLD